MPRIVLENLDFLEDAYKSADLITAFERGRDIGDVALYIISALHTVFSFLEFEFRERNLLDKIESVYVEYTSVGESISYAGLRDFAGYRLYRQGLSLNYQDAYFYTYNYLHMNNITIFYHPDFFLRPTSMQALISEYNEIRHIITINSNNVRNSVNSATFLPIQQRPTFYPIDPGTFFTLAEIEGKAEEPSGQIDFGSLEANHRIFHSLFHEFLLGSAFDRFRSYMFSIPLVGAPVGWFRRTSQVILNPYLEGVGGIFIYILGNENLYLSPDFQREIARRVSYLMKDIILNFVYRNAVSNLNEAKDNSAAAAIGAIMARNMSHNIGSHIISEMTSDGSPANQLLLRNFYRYLQHRMDFIAQITTEIPAWSYPAWFHKEIMKEFYSQFVLLDRLNISEGLRAYDWPDGGWKAASTRGKFIIRTATQNNGQTKWIYDEFYKDKGGDDQRNNSPMSQQREAQNKGKESETSAQRKYGDISQDDFQVAVPGGTVGFHAFYVIFEDFIRNEAKHAYVKIRKKLKEDVEGKNGKGKILILTKKPDELDIQIDKVESNFNGNNYSAVLILCDCDLKPDNLSKLNTPIFKCVNNLKEAEEWHNKGIPWSHLLSPKDWDALKCFLKLRDIDAFIDHLTAIPLRINIKIEDDKENPEILWVTIWSDLERKDGEKVFVIKSKRWFYSRKMRLKWNSFNRKIEFIKKDPKDEIEINVSGELFDRIRKLVEKKESEKKDTLNEEELLLILKELKEYERVSKLLPLFHLLNLHMETSLIDERGRLRREHWGLAEQKISGGFLQSKGIRDIYRAGDFFTINNRRIIQMKLTKNRIPKGIGKFLPVDEEGNPCYGKKNCNNGKYYLGFRFWVRRPKEVMYVNGGGEKEKGKEEKGKSEETSEEKGGE